MKQSRVGLSYRARLSVRPFLAPAEFAGTPVPSVRPVEYDIYPRTSTDLVSVATQISTVIQKAFETTDPAGLSLSNPFDPAIIVTCSLALPATSSFPT
ncbi:hypothetical protein PtA15_4A773 [Puccinia triticina]|uniref:Uncharacterized protein n=1 Tax=Puccinia triticina TaxID=208348 RepID=A0ABY7CKJ0_9BASI|nr:uncharacterized protein PtA15_4A773 [Puccinia triticina]WAQ84320.1 hypothetical protein PtA15_4A773 [Puccinia triticina]WAR55140.1 hypothetical protein PtB15_4B760 [Puccinia triticina]